MPRKTKDQKDRTSIVISVVIHVLLIGGVAYWAYKTGKLQEALETILKIAQGDKKEAVKEDKPPPRPTARPKTGALPPSAPPPGGGGTRRAVASDAPAAAGETFFEDTRTQVGDGSGGAGPKEEKKVTPVIVLRPPPKVDLRPPVATGKGSTAKLIQERQSAKTVSDSIGAEAIERSTSSDVGDVVSKVTGTTLVDGKFAVVRGLSDRYTATTLNGGEIPTPDPYRRQVQLDIFPAKIVQSVNVIKTFTPDLPGAFAGGLIDIRTKSFPEKFTFSVTAGVGYNTQASLNPDFITDQESGWDAWAFGSKARALPGILENASPPPPPGRPPLNESPASAYARRNQANLLAAMTDSFSSSVMGPVKTESGLNQSYNLVVGDTVRMLERPFGYFFGVDYKNGYSYYDNGEVGRYGPRLETRRLLTETRGIHAVDWTAAVNLSYQLNPDNELNFNFLYNQSGENIARNDVGDDFTTGSTDTLNLNTLDYIERNLTTYQLRGSHLLPTLNEFKVEWLAGLSSTYQVEPDERFFNYWTYNTETGGTGNYFNNNLPQPIRPTRFFRTIEEDSSNLKLDMTAPFRQWADLESSFKFGAFYNGIQRTFDEKTYTYQTQTGDAGWIDGGVPNNYLAPRYLGYTTEVIPRRGTNFTFQRYINSELGNSTYEGEQIVPAGYGMVDLALTDSVRFIGGVRAEGTDLTIDTVTSQYPNGTNTVINQLDILPAIGFLWNIKSNMNLRVNYGKTIGRPAFREIAPVRVYDIVNDVIYEGNPSLQITEIQNYDIRWEWFPRLGEVVSAGFFFKKLKNAIEAYAVTLDDGIITFVNRDEAILLGIELEGRTSLDILDANLANFSVGGNLSFIYSKVELTPTELFNKRIYDPNAEASRPLYDQSPYIINLDLSYSNPSSGTTATISANLAGERIFFAKAAGPDVYEHPPASLDFVISQQLSRHMKIKFTARNLLNSPVLRTYGTSDQYIYTRYTRGLTFGLSLSYDF